jgi:predicted dehydrogenase
MKKNDPLVDLNRRDFIKGGSAATLMMLMGGLELRAAETSKSEEAPTQYRTTGEPLKCAVIGCGAWGREILMTLAKLPNAPVMAICDNYAPFLKRVKDLAPKAEGYKEYKDVLTNKEVEGVIIATPSHKHREIAVAALEAGKHVYCEMPLATTVEDARGIAQMASKSFKLNFQPGLQIRSSSPHYFLMSFIRTGAMGKHLKANAQWHKKQSWRRASPNPERDKDINWRLDNATSGGLVGEIGVHQIDLANWVQSTLPIAVSGVGAIQLWNQDGRNVPDNIQAFFEYPDKVFYTYEASLASSFESENNIFYGTNATLMVRDNRAWMFKEVDSPMLGWEVYAKKETFYKDSGIVLRANATKLAKGKKPGEDDLNEKPPLQEALEAFVSNSKVLGAAVEDFTANFDPKEVEAFKTSLADAMKTKLRAPGYKEGLEATICAIKANEAMLKGEKIRFQKSWFEV